MLLKSNKTNKEQRVKSKEQSHQWQFYVVPWLDWKKPACILHAPFSDVQDANEMRMVEDTTQDVRTRSYRTAKGLQNGDKRLQGLERKGKSGKLKAERGKVRGGRFRRGDSSGDARQYR